jgi:hypothetical protein
MDEQIEELVAQGYTPAEAKLVLHVVDTAHAERQSALRTGRCGCGTRLRRQHSTLECPGCGACHAA